MMAAGAPLSTVQQIPNPHQVANSVAGAPSSASRPHHHHQQLFGAHAALLDSNCQFDIQSVEESALANGGYLNVWKNNLDAAFALLRANLKKGYTFVSMDTEFPGIVARPYDEINDYVYQCLKCNVDLLKLIQVGLTLYNKDGDIPEVHTWQFNFHFDLKKDMYAQDSIELLQKSGLNFKNHDTDGISELKFASYLITSGLVLIPGVTWISFHSIYDFGYLLKILMNKPLPDSEQLFYSNLKIYFKQFYDIKLITEANLSFKGGLQELGHKYEIKRVGKQHQAGSDAHLTGKIFFAIKNEIENSESLETLKCQLFSLANAPILSDNSSNNSSNKSSAIK